MQSPLLNREISKRPDKVKLKGRILFLTEDPQLIKRQLAGEDLPWDTKNPANNPKLRDDISTDEITPAHYCFYFDETLGEIPYLGGERKAAWQGQQPGAEPIRGAVRGHSAGDRGEY